MLEVVGAYRVRDGEQSGFWVRPLRERPGFVEAVTCFVSALTTASGSCDHAQADRASRARSGNRC